MAALALKDFANLPVASCPDVPRYFMLGKPIGKQRLFIKRWVFVGPPQRPQLGLPRMGPMAEEKGCTIPSEAHDKLRVQQKRLVAMGIQKPSAWVRV